MKGTTADDCANQINRPNNMKIMTIGIIHQSLFAQRNENSSPIMDNLEFILLSIFMILNYINDSCKNKRLIIRQEKY